MADFRHSHNYVHVYTSPFTEEGASTKRQLTAQGPLTVLVLPPVDNVPAADTRLHGDDTSASSTRQGAVTCPTLRAQ